MSALPMAIDAPKPITLNYEALKRARIIADKCAEFMAFSLACQVAGVSYPCAAGWKRNSAEFQELLAEAAQTRLHKLEAEAWRRGIAGSDLLLIFMLKAAAPGTYDRAQKLELTGPNGTPLELNDAQRATRIASMVAAMMAKGASGDAQVIDDAEFHEVAAPCDDDSDLL